MANCAICVDGIGNLLPEDLDGDGRTVLICQDCRELPATDDRYSFDEGEACDRASGTKQNVGDGNRKRSKNMGGRSAR